MTALNVDEIRARAEEAYEAANYRPRNKRNAAVAADVLSLLDEVEQTQHDRFVAVKEWQTSEARNAELTKALEWLRMALGWQVFRESRPADLSNEMRDIQARIAAALADGGKETTTVYDSEKPRA